MNNTSNQATRVGREETRAVGTPAIAPRINSERPVRKYRDNRRRRRGATAVEFAIVAIPLFLFLFASIEFGRAMMAMQSMEEAARGGVREAVLKEADLASVEEKVDEMMKIGGISNYEVEIEPANFESAERWTPVTVVVTATFSDMSWLPVPMYLGDLSYTSACTLPKESSPES